MTAKERHRISMGKISRSKQTKHLRLLSNMFPDCNKTYPDCPEYPIDISGNVHKACVKCPIYMESSTAKNRI